MRYEERVGRRLPGGPFLVAKKQQKLLRLVSRGTMLGTWPVLWERS